MSSSSRRPGPYQSALDLPSVAAMLEQLRGFKALTRVIARDQRPKLLELEADLNRLCQLIDDFYALLGNRNWIFHENLNVEEITALVKLPPEEAEHRLIDLYKDRETLQFMIRQLNRFPQLRDRLELIKQAEADYHEGRYYSVVLVLLAVMDGFVNDLDPQARRGLHTRAADEMAAWDSVVGHHLGLTNAHKTFGKGFRKLSHEEVHELYRNGIMHGMLTNFDNDIVATKAWNRLFAVADWAASLQRQAAPQEPEPTWGELAQKIQKNEQTKRALDAWQPSVITSADPEFANDPLHKLTSEYLSAWQSKNYGKMAQALSPLVRKESDKQTAGMVREQYDLFELTDFATRKMSFEGPAVCEVDVDLTIGNEDKPARMRWIRSGDDGMGAAPDEPGEWRLVLWGPMALINHAKEVD